MTHHLAITSRDHCDTLCILVCEKTGKPILSGEPRENFCGDTRHPTHGDAPHKSGSAGQYTDATGVTYYVASINAKWVPIEEEGHTVHWRCDQTEQTGEMSFESKSAAMQFTTLFSPHVTVTVAKD